MGRDNGWRGGKGFQEQLQRSHGQNQDGLESGERGVDGWGQGGSCGGKCRQLYLNKNNFKKRKKIKYAKIYCFKEKIEEISQEENILTIV